MSVKLLCLNEDCVSPYGREEMVVIDFTDTGTVRECQCCGTQIEVETCG